jgi:hypothetical protein
MAAKERDRSPRAIASAAAALLLTTLTLLAAPSSAQAGSAPRMSEMQRGAPAGPAALDDGAREASRALPGPCDAPIIPFDVWAELGYPYSFNEGVVGVSHRQYRLSDVNFAMGWSDRPGTTMTMYRTGGTQCGPVTLNWNGSRYQGFVGRMNNRYAGIWVCLNWPGGGRCTEAKYE